MSSEHSKNAVLYTSPMFRRKNGGAMNDQTQIIIMKKNSKDKYEVDSDVTKSKKIASGSASRRPHAKRNDKSEADQQGSYRFQKNEGVDKNKLTPREEL